MDNKRVAFPAMKSEIVITKLGMTTVGGMGLDICVANSRAASWIEQEAPRFGNLKVDKVNEGDHRDLPRFTLTVNPNWDGLEVGRWLLRNFDANIGMPDVVEPPDPHEKLAEALHEAMAGLFSNRRLSFEGDGLPEVDSDFAG